MNEAFLVFSLASGLVAVCIHCTVVAIAGRKRR